MSTGRADKLNKLLEWATKSGATISDEIVFKADDKTKQIHAVANATISKDSQTPLIQIPESITISPILAESFFGSNICGSKDRNPITKLLLAKLRFDTNNDTTLEINGKKVNGREYFKAYIDILPDGKETGSPLFWDSYERGLILGTNAHLSIDKRLYIILEEWYSTVTQLSSEASSKDIKQDLEFYEVFKTGKPEHFASYLNQTTGEVSWTSFPAYLWSTAIFNSRAFPYILQKESSIGSEVNDLSEAVLLPIFDLLNHNTESKVKWNFNDSKIYSFLTNYEIKEKEEVFNSYGVKSNDLLLFNYGFVIPDNKEDITTLALRIPAEQVKDAENFGVKGFKGDQISFVFSYGFEELDPNLLRLFQFLVKYPGEKGVTLRNSLEGLKQLGIIIQNKLDTIKNVKVPEKVNIDSSIITVSKAYRSIQKSYLQQISEKISKEEKIILKKYKPETFKTYFKNDNTFANALLLTFGIDSYEKLISSEDDLDHVLNLWLMRVSNMELYNEKNILPRWVNDRFKSINSKIDESDVKETLPVYKALFPKLSEKIPEIFSKGDWSIKRFILAEKLKGEIVFIRKASNEAYFIKDVKI